MTHPFTGRAAIEYDFALDIRFADLDPYGHLNSGRYLDLVNTSRLIYLERCFSISVSDLISRGVGFYMVKASQEFLRPVKGLRQVRVTSHLASVDGDKLSIPYEISDLERTRVFSKGVLEYFVINLETQKPMAMPEWLVDCFFAKPNI